jgi:hypothetical protein
MGKNADAVYAEEEPKQNQELELATAAKSRGQASDRPDEKEDCAEKNVHDVIANQHERRIRRLHRSLHGPDLSAFSIQRKDFQQIRVADAASRNGALAEM